MIWFPLALAVVAAVAGLRYLVRLRQAHRADAPPTVDDDAIRQILERGTLPSPSDRLDMREIARAEEDFWAESWDEPDEYPRQ
jgi:hypothetical protein